MEHDWYAQTSALCGLEGIKLESVIRHPCRYSCLQSFLHIWEVTIKGPVFYHGSKSNQSVSHQVCIRIFLSCRFAFMLQGPWYMVYKESGNVRFRLGGQIDMHSTLWILPSFNQFICHSYLNTPLGKLYALFII